MKKIGVVSQKGGVGKSTIARDIARQFAADGLRVKIADLDLKQTTSASWNALRQAADIKPEISVESFKTAASALNIAGFDVLIFDAKPHSDIDTKRIAEVCDLIVIPTAATRDDLAPQTALGRELVENGIKRDRIVFILNGVIEHDDSVTEEARAFITSLGFKVVDQAIPLRKSYQNAQNQGLSISEVTFPGLRDIALNAVNGIADALTKKVPA